MTREMIDRMNEILKEIEEGQKEVEELNNEMLSLSNTIKEQEAERDSIGDKNSGFYADQQKKIDETKKLHTETMIKREQKKHAVNDLIDKKRDGIIAELEKMRTEIDENRNGEVDDKYKKELEELTRYEKYLKEQIDLNDTTGEELLYLNENERQEVKLAQDSYQHNIKQLDDVRQRKNDIEKNMKRNIEILDGKSPYDRYKEITQDIKFLKGKFHYDTIGETKMFVQEKDREKPKISKERPKISKEKFIKKDKVDFAYDKDEFERAKEEAQKAREKREKLMEQGKETKEDEEEIEFFIDKDPDKETNPEVKKQLMEQLKETGYIKDDEEQNETEEKEYTPEEIEKFNQEYEEISRKYEEVLKEFPEILEGIEREEKGAEGAKEKADKEVEDFLQQERKIEEFRKKHTPTPFRIKQPQIKNNSGEVKQEFVPKYNNLNKPNQQSKPIDKKEEKILPEKIDEITIIESMNFIAMRYKEKRKVRSLSLESAVKDGRQRLKEKQLKNMCKKIAGGRIKGFLLRKKLNPAIISVLDAEREYKGSNSIEKYIDSIAKYKNLDFELYHDIRDSELEDRDRKIMRKAAQIEKNRVEMGIDDLKVFVAGLEEGDVKRLNHGRLSRKMIRGAKHATKPVRFVGRTISRAGKQVAETVRDIRKELKVNNRNNVLERQAIKHMLRQEQQQERETAAQEIGDD